MRSRVRCFLVLVAAAQALYVTGATAQSREDELVRSLLSDDAATRDAARDEILATRSRIVDGLVAIVSDWGHYVGRGDSYYQAVTLLGQMRAPEAVGPLVAHVGFKRYLPPTPEGAVIEEGGLFWERPGEGLSRWPVPRSLVAIGEPSVEPVLARLSQRCADAERVGCLYVLMWLRGCAGAEALVEDALARVDTEETKAALGLAAERLRGLVRLVDASWGVRP